VRSKWQRQVNQAYLAVAPKVDGKCEKCILHKVYTETTISQVSWKCDGRWTDLSGCSK